MGVTEERIERLKKWAETLESCGKTAVDISSELGALLQNNQQMGQQIERLNEANDRLRERLGHGDSRVGYMKLPVDADGEPIRVGDEVFRLVDGMKLYVSAIEFTEEGCLIMAKTSPNLLASGYTGNTLRHKKPEAPDSWEKLEEDLLRGSTADAYFECFDISCSERPHSREVTGSYCWMNRNLDILARAKKLAGIEGEER